MQHFQKMRKVIQITKKNKKFRLNTKNLFLTYFQTFITREEVLS